MAPPRGGTTTVCETQIQHTYNGIQLGGIPLESPTSLEDAKMNEYPRAIPVGMFLCLVSAVLSTHPITQCEQHIPPCIRVTYSKAKFMLAGERFTSYCGKMRGNLFLPLSHFRSGPSEPLVAP